MKSLSKNILDGLTFTDIAGKRHPRTYVVLAAIILILLGTLASCIALEHQSMMNEVQGTPNPVDVTAVPAASAEPTQEAVTEEPCPIDPAKWVFTDTLPGVNFKRIEPACVYEGLGQSVAWALAVRSGYTRAEAAEALGFADFPMRRLSEVTALTDTKGPASLAVTFTPPHPDFAEWRVGGDGKPAISYALRGCFRTYEVVGNQAKSWNKDYPVICTLSEDSYGSGVVYQLGGHTYASFSEPTRSFALFGYAGNGNWVWLGTQKEPKISLADMPDFREESIQAANFHDLPIWGGTWLEKTYGLAEKTLPEGWQSMTKEEDKKAILETLNAAMKEAQP
jgi:hypothetical protein